MDTVIAAFENPKFGRQVGELLEGAGVAQVLPCSSGDQVRRLLQRQGACCVICGPHLTDGPSEWLCGDLPPSCLMLMCAVFVNEMVEHYTVLRAVHGLSPCISLPT